MSVVVTAAQIEKPSIHLAMSPVCWISVEELFHRSAGNVEPEGIVAGRTSLSGTLKLKSIKR